MKYFNIAYFGSSDFSADFLEKLVTDTSIKRLIEVKFVVTQPDRKVGRKQILTPTLVKTVAQRYEIKVKFQILNLKSQINNKSQIKNPKRLEFGNSDLFGAWDLELDALKNIDFALVYAYGAIIPKDLLALPKYGFWCIHPSLLPKYRGASPMATALINGDKTTGVTIIKMDEKIDHGPIIAQEKYEILATDKRPDLEVKLTDLAFEMFKKLIGEDAKFFATWEVRSGASTPLELKNFGIEPLIEQNHQQVTYTKKLKKEDGFIPFENWKLEIENSPEKIFNLFRGLYPWPGLWTILPNGKRLKITDMKLYNFKNFITLKLLSVQLEGKKEVDFETFNKAYKVF